MRILIIGIGNPVPPFIRRRLAALVSAGLELVIVAEYGQVVDLPVSFVRIGGDQTVFYRLKLILRALALPHLLFLMLKSRPTLRFQDRLRWAVKYLPLIRVSPGVVHFQWLASAAEFEWLRKFFKCPFVASARGSQVTVYPITRRGYKETIQAAIKVVDLIHCVSHDIARACEGLGARKDQLFVNYNGVDINHFRAVPNPKPSDAFTIVSVGALVWRKGHFYQLQMLSELVRAGRNVRLLIVGEGPDFEGLHYVAHKLAVLHCITFAGRVLAHEIPLFLMQADAFISTSIAEGLANSVVEACACGLPVIAFDCEGMNEIVETGLNGYILPFGDVKGLTEKMIYLMDNPDTKSNMGFASRKKVEETFDDDHWISLMINKYTSLEKKYNSAHPNRWQ